MVLIPSHWSFVQTKARLPTLQHRQGARHDEKGDTFSIITSIGAERRKAQKSPAGHCPQNRGIVKPPVGTKSSREVGRWTHGYGLEQTGQKDR